MMNAAILMDTIECLEEDEREIIETLLDRISDGRKSYGPWVVSDDNRNYPHEALSEVMDALHYCSAELVKLKKQQFHPARRQRVYICHQYGANPKENTARIAIITRALLDNGLVPIAPQLFLPQLYDEKKERFQALKKCIEYLRGCDEVRVYGSKISEGMRQEITYANLFGIPVLFAEETEA